MKYHNTLDSVVFDQTAAEDIALFAQGFELARVRIALKVYERLRDGGDPSKLYIISDLDETLLDNSAYNAWLIETGRDFHDDTWRIWCSSREAMATPGSLRFASSVAAQGIKIFYVSSRFEENRNDTATNLRDLGFPLPDSSDNPDATFLFLAGMSLVAGGPRTKKKEQYDFIRQRMGSAPLLHLGDNLSDHEPDRYSSKIPMDQRVLRAEEEISRWGDDWIVFPNPVYGAWRQSLKRQNLTGQYVTVADENPPANFQPGPVRDTVTEVEAPKLGILRRWSPNPPI
jgi:5'-nucleotidase (lipoprotein e(P4) family)